jgi:phage terminase large subunit-like protein
MSEFDYKAKTKDLSHDQLKALALLIKERKAAVAAEPLKKHKFNNYGQARIRGCKKKYRAINAGNKTGKTDEFGFELVAICKGQAEEFGINFPHKPPLKIWYCGRDRNVLSDEPLSSIKRYLKGEGIDHRTVWTGQAIQRMYIWDDDGNQSEIWFKPYNGEIGIFESANVHAVFMDEEPPRDIFSAIKTKIAIMPGYVFIAMTPDKGMSWTYDLYQGTDPDHGNLIREGMFEIVKASVFDNIENFKTAQKKDWVRFPLEFIEKVPSQKYKTINGICHILAPDTFVDYIKQFTFGSPEYRMRILGDYVSFTGKVYPFDPALNSFELHELPPFNELKFFGALDWGYRDECCFALIAIDKNDVKYVIDGFYQSYLDAREQARLMKSICDFWGVIPEMIVADNQIQNTLAQADALKTHIQDIESYYLDELPPHWTHFRCEELDKRDPHIKRDKIRCDLRDGKLKFSNFENRVFQHAQEIQRLEYADGSIEKLKGKDHCDATLRMFYGANVQFNSWLTSQQIKERKKVHPSYQIKQGPIY